MRCTLTGQETPGGIEIMAGWVEKRGENTWRLNAPGGTGPNGMRKIYRKVVEASSERQAKKLLAEFVSDVQKGLYVEPSHLTLSQFVEQWIRDYGVANLAPKTLHRYKQIFARALLAMGHLKLEQIKPIHLVEFYSNLREEGIRGDGKPGKLSDSTVLSHHRVLSSLFSDAVKWVLIPFNPAARVDPPKAKTKQAACFDEEQTAILLAALDQEQLQYKTMVVLDLATGLRRGELLGLEWPDINFEQCTIEISRASQYLPGMGTFTKDPKNETSKRLIAVPASIVDLLKQYKAEQNEERLKIGDRWRDSNRLFTTWDGRPMHPDTISSWFHDFLATVATHKCGKLIRPAKKVCPQCGRKIKDNDLTCKCGKYVRPGEICSQCGLKIKDDDLTWLPRLNFHALRHTSATLLIAEGVPLKNVSSRLGHADTRTTDTIYAHALRSVDQAAAEKMDRILASKNKGQAKAGP